MLITINMLVIAPAAYLAIAIFWLPSGSPVAAEVDLVFYILLIVAALTPTTLPLIERAQLHNFQQQTRGEMPSSQLYYITTITKLALVESAFIMGLVVHMLGGGVWRMLVFYLIGICWSFVHWPREEKMQKFLQRSERI